MAGFGIGGFAVVAIGFEATALTAGAIAATWAAVGVATLGIGAVLGGVVAGIYAVSENSWTREQAVKEAQQVVMLQL